MIDGAGGEGAFFLARGFARRLGFGHRPAVLVIDFMRAFTDPRSPLGAALDREVAETVHLVTVARAAGAPIIYTVVAYDQPGERDAGLWPLKAEGLRMLRAGSPAVALDPRLERRPEDAVLVKKHSSSFFETDLASRLNSRQIDTLILAGCSTSGCVRATAVDGLQSGFRVMVVWEAVGDRSAAAHRQSLFDLDAKYCDVVGVAETLTYLARVRNGMAEPAAVAAPC